jgi:hypothetical protein
VTNGAAGGTGDEVADRTAAISARLKRIYRKAVLPVEKRYRYDYFYESPLLSDVEFDGASLILLIRFNSKRRFKLELA